MILLLCGLVAQLLFRDYLNFFNHRLINIPVLLFFLGATIAMISMVGLLGVWLNKVLLLTCYISLLVVSLTVEVVMVLLYYHYQDTVSLFLQHHLLQGLTSFTDPQFRGVTETWNVAQHEVGICREH